MKILHVVNNIRHDDFSFELAKKMSETKHEIVIASYFEDNKKIPDFDDRSNLETYGLNCSILDRIFSPLKLFFYLREINPDIVHTHHVESGVATRLASFIKNENIVNTEHFNHESFLFSSLLSALAKLVNGLTLSFADVVVSNSYETKKSFKVYEKKLTKNTPHKVIHNGADFERVRSNLQKSNLFKKRNLSNSISLCTVAKLRPEKNLKSLLKALNLIHDEVNGIKLIIIGDGPLKNDLQEFAEKNNLSDLVLFTGTVKRTEVYRILHDIDIFIMPSVSEGFCNAVVEAHFAANPVILSNISTFRELFNEGVLFFNPHDPHDIAEAVFYLINNPEFREELAEKGFKNAKKKFSLQKTIDEYFSLYKKIINK